MSGERKALWRIYGIRCKFAGYAQLLMILTPTCTLRAFCDQDASNLQRYANNLNISGNLRDRFPHPYTLEHAQAFIRLQQAREEKAENLAITSNDRLIGVIGIILQDDIYRMNAEIGYWVAEEFWGQGIATDALKGMVQYAFSNFGIHRLFAGVFEYNLASMAVLRKAGFRKEAVHEKKVMKQGKLYDEHVFVLLKKEAGGLSG